MKKKLLLLTLTFAVFCLTQNAQTKVWDFGGDSNYTSADQITMWPVVSFNAAEATTVEKDGLFLVGDSDGDKFGQVENSGGKTWDEGTADEYKAINRFKFNGGSNPDDNNLNPTHSYMYFPVSGPVSVKVWYRSGGSSERTLYISDETSVLSEVTKTDDTEAYTITADYAGTGENIKIYCSNSFNLYKIEVTGAGAATLSLTPIQETIKTKVKAYNNRIYISNVNTKTEVKIYSITGALVKTINTTRNTNIGIKNGLWVAKIKTDKGKKTLKLLAH
ncbi:T9SS type A sorting domain-containing protein [Polaribacter sp.]|uniref:T9SS type A sorting domain-containing protein n=1 Tax=Polaribacter sp. TaxID=1920175 RepID=UPI003F6C92E3